MYRKGHKSLEFLLIKLFTINVHIMWSLILCINHHVVVCTPSCLLSPCLLQQLSTTHIHINNIFNVPKTVQVTHELIQHDRLLQAHKKYHLLL